jgi:hypothetical protein
VRPLVAVVVMLVFASLIAIDGICCPRSIAQRPDQHSSDGSCMLCLGGIDSAAAPALSPSGIVTNRIGLPPLSSHLNALTKPPEHPPRA